MPVLVPILIPITSPSSIPSSIRIPLRISLLIPVLIPSSILIFLCITIPILVPVPVLVPIPGRARTCSRTLTHWGWQAMVARCRAVLPARDLWAGHRQPRGTRGTRPAGIPPPSQGTSHLGDLLPQHGRTGCCPGARCLGVWVYAQPFAITRRGHRDRTLSWLRLGCVPPSCTPGGVPMVSATYRHRFSR